MHLTGAKPQPGELHEPTGTGTAAAYVYPATSQSVTGASDAAAPKAEGGAGHKVQGFLHEVAVKMHLTSEHDKSDVPHDKE